MEARFLLDTNICIYIRRNKPEQVLRRLPNPRSWPGRAPGHYLLANWPRERRRVRLARWPEVAAETYGQIQADLERKGLVIATAICGFRRMPRRSTNAG